ncbi:exocyst complex component 1-like [Saccoglossus kowalevskii]|uniref:Exocyst complex component 1-like n=1 Tax=Saccoglossus kowalevskii TaxID=10224 RepID=A0ABM0M2H0_SACKO|nr:PREDICTED: exocyst complex component 1-like [Saccoglossus kowalevskii]
MTAIRHTLQREVFLPNEERLISVVHVTKAGKKKKNSFLCAAVTTDQPAQVSLYKVKKSEKDTYKKRESWLLSDLKVVDGKDTTKDVAEFDLQFEKIFKWIASNEAEKNAFITSLWKGNELGETLGRHSSELTLPKHYSSHRDLLPYTDLMLWLKKAKNVSYTQLFKQSDYGKSDYLECKEELQLTTKLIINLLSSLY